MDRISTLLAMVGAVLTLLGNLPRTSADTVFIIDPAFSFLDMTGDTAGGATPVVPQSPGSEILTFAGQITVSVGGGNISFNGANADAALQPGPLFPAIGGGAGAAPADGGLSIGPGLGTLALRDFAFTLSGTTALVGGTNFDPTDLTFEVIGGSLDYNVPAFALAGNENLVGITTSPTGGTGTLLGDALAIPLAVTLSFSIGEVPISLHLNGQLVTYIPEPNTAALLGTGLVALVTLRYRRFRRD